jgi:hypothetical protein
MKNLCPMTARKSSRKRDGRAGQLAGLLDMDALEKLQGALVPWHNTKSVRTGAVVNKIFPHKVGWDKAKKIGLPSIDQLESMLKRLSPKSRLEFDLSRSPGLVKP